MSRHGIFHEYEHNVVSLPGLHFDSAAAGEDEVWLVVDRLHESAAPEPKSVLLKVWIDITNNPAKEPTLRTHVEVKELLAIGAIAVEKDSNDPDRLIGFDAYPRRQEVEALLKSYGEIVWKPWAIEEKRRRRTILAGIFVGLSFAWVGNAQSIMQSEEINRLAEYRKGGFIEYVYAFQTAILTIMVTLVLWGMAGLNIFDSRWPTSNQSVSYFVVKVILFAFSSMTLRECWHVIIGAQWLLIAQRKIKNKNKN